MEAKMSRAAAIATLCVLLLVLPGQVAAKSKFCECYDDCYRQCRHHVPRFACVPFCANKCSPNLAAAAAAGSDRDRCRVACSKVQICGESDPSDGECDRGCY
ncbi:hypothetical protein CFC21_086753 [Triticum aestivum]|uniref:Acidic protein n=2 Tax=Triticum aestivum TaxID=4565 RepID=A0A9R1IFU8_WHEAT|nr:hypothetical protein CFC21_086753 [Triticum aestivum]